MKEFLHLTVTLLIIVSARTKTRGYRGYQVLKVLNVPEDAIELLNQVVDGRNEGYNPEDPEQMKLIEYWTDPAPDRDCDIMVATKIIKAVKGDLTKLELKHSLMIRSVHNLILKQLKTNDEAPDDLKEQPGHKMTWDAFCDLDEFQSYFNFLEENYPNLFRTEHIGYSYENRSMVVAKICSDGCPENRPAMWVDAGIHGNDWTGPASIMFMIRELVENYSKHPHLIDKLNWYILPVANPDGYAYTQLKVQNRFWRKTRSLHKSPYSCYGVDANRNFEFNWNEYGLFEYPCDDMYRGPMPFSEIELQNIGNFLLTKVPHIVFANSIHSYGERILLPWISVNDTINPSYSRMISAALDAADAIESTHGRKFSVESIPDSLYSANGAAMNWFVEKIKVPFVYSLELRDDKKYGFLLPPDEIIPSGEEVFAFHSMMATVILDEFLDEK